VTYRGVGGKTKWGVLEGERGNGAPSGNFFWFREKKKTSNLDKGGGGRGSGMGIGELYSKKGLVKTEEPNPTKRSRKKIKFCGVVKKVGKCRGTKKKEGQQSLHQTQKRV